MRAASRAIRAVGVAVLGQRLLRLATMGCDSRSRARRARHVRLSGDGSNCSDCGSTVAAAVRTSPAPSAADGAACAAATANPCRRQTKQDAVAVADHAVVADRAACRGDQRARGLHPAVGRRWSCGKLQCVQLGVTPCLAISSAWLPISTMRRLPERQFDGRVRWWTDGGDDQRGAFSISVSSAAAHGARIRCPAPRWLHRGSAAARSSGWRAMAMRWRWPPDSACRSRHEGVEAVGHRWMKSRRARRCRRRISSAVASRLLP